MLSDYPTMDLEPENDNQLFFFLNYQARQLG